MILKVFSIIIKKFIDGFDAEDYPNSTYSAGLSYPASVNLPFDERDYPYTSGFFLVYDGDDKNKNVLTIEILNKTGLKEKRDYMIHKEIVYFTTMEHRKLYDKIGQEIHSGALAAYNFKHLQKSNMGKIAFVDENRFYIIIRPKANMEKELLNEVTLFFKGHGYDVGQEHFQENFFSYENFALRFYVKDEAMAAELGFYIEGKNLGSILL